MIDELTHPDVLAFIQDHKNDDPAELMLKAHKLSNLPLKFIAEQIASRQRAESKLPEWHGNSKLIFPPKHNLEQASSQQTAKFKARLLSGSVLADLTGGSGIDCYYLAHNFKSTTYVEPNRLLCEIASHNYKELNKNINIEISTAEQFLENIDQTLDWLFIDPSRRDDTMSRVYALEDCEPNVITIKKDLLSKSKKVLIKASPMLDIKRTLKEFPECYLIQTVAVNNDVKELLMYLDRDNKGEACIEAWNLLKNGEEEHISFLNSNAEKHHSKISDIQDYIYEPNSAIMKSGGFNTITKLYDISKLHVNTHLYTSNELIPDFPGKVLKVKDVFSASKKEVKKRVKDGLVNVIARNFPQGANELKKKFKLRDGGNEFLLFCETQQYGFKTILCERES